MEGEEAELQKSHYTLMSGCAKLGPKARHQCDLLPLARNTLTSRCSLTVMGQLCHDSSLDLNGMWRETEGSCPDSLQSVPWQSHIFCSSVAGMLSINRKADIGSHPSLSLSLSLCLCLSLSATRPCPSTLSDHAPSLIVKPFDVHLEVQWNLHICWFSNHGFSCPGVYRGPGTLSGRIPKMKDS